MRLIDLSSRRDTETVIERSDFTSPIEEIFALIQDAYENKIKVLAKDMLFVDKKVHELKNRIINHVCDMPTVSSY